MSFLKLSGRTCVTLAALAMLAASPQAAWAETIFLKCGSWDVAAIDLTNRTVNNIPADITPVSIDWDKVSKGGGVHVHIDRVKGTMTVSGTYKAGNTPITPMTDTCTVVSQPQTKF